MLECVVEYYKIDFRIKLKEAAYAFDSIFTYGYRNTVVEFAENLVGFIADVAGRVVAAGHYEAFGTAFVAAAQHSYAVAVA